MPKTEKKTTKKVKAVKADKVVKAKKAVKAEKVDKDVKAVKTVKAIKAPQETDNNGIDKKKIIETYGVKKNDTGSPEVQIALLSARIKKLSDHLTENKKDNHSRRGLLGLVSKRRRLLVYLQDKNQDRYKELIKKIGLKK